MSRTVDERVVSMQFDNRHFEQNVKTTMSTLDKLKRSLKFDSAAKGFEEISASAKKCDLSPVSKGVENVRSGFSAFEVMAVTALANITNSAVNAGKRIIKALTLDPVTTGFSEYETKINAVQTIMSNTASKGTTMADVTRVLNELNLYADKTIYNFAEMTRNIGTFTAAGVGLEEAASAIQGIANLAAASGSTSQQASTAMYQLSQALAAGTVKLMDWNSVVNAGMGGEKFQLALKETAREHGIAVDDMIKKEGSFRESLKHGWITADVLNNTLKKFTVEGAKEYAASMGYSAEQTAALVKEAQSMEDAATKVKTFTQLWDTMKESAQSGWAQTWELIIGDFEEAKEFLTGLSDLFGGIINGFSDARNTLLGEALNSNWEKLTKRINDAGVETEDFTDKIRECAESGGINVDELVKKYGSLGKAFKAGAIDSKYLTDALNKIREVGTKTSNKLSVDVDQIKSTLSFGSTGDEVKVLQQALVDLGFSLDQFGVDGIIGAETTGAIKKFQESVGLLATGVVGEETIEALKKAGITIEEIGDKSKLAKLSISDLAEGISELGGRELLIKGLMDAVKSVVDVFKIFGSSWKKAIDPIVTSTGLYNAIKSFADFAAGLRTIDDATGELTGRGKQLARIFDGMVAVLDVFMTITGGLAKMGLKALSGALGMVNVDILELVARVGDALVAFRDWFDGNNVFTKGLEYTVKAIGYTISAFVELTKKILEMPAVQRVLRTIEGTFADVMVNVGSYLSGGLDRIKEFIETVKAMDSITLDDLKALLINFKENVIDYFFDIDSLYDKFVSAFTTVRTSNETNLQNAGEKLEWVKEKAVALANFIKDKLPAAIAIGMGAMLVKAAGRIADALELLSSPLELVETIGDALTRVSKAYAFKTVTQGVMNLAIAVGILAASVVVLTMVNPDRLWSVVGALTALMGVLALLAGAVALIEKFGDFGKSSTAIVALSGSLLLIAAALKVMEGIDGKKALKSAGILGLIAVTMGTVLGVLGKFVPKLSSGSLTFLALAGALRVMVDALVELDNAEFNNIGKSLTLMLGIIASLGLIAKACGSISLGSAVGIIAIAIGLKLLVGVIEDIGNIDAGKLTGNIEALVAVFASFAVLMVASRFAGANALKAGVGIVAISAAMLLIVKAMGEMGKLDGATVSKATDAISQLLIVFGAIVGLSYFAGQNAVKAGVMLLLISGAMIILAGVIHLIKGIPAVDLAKAVGAIAALEILFGGLIFVSKYGEISKGTTALLIELTVIIGLMALIIVGLSKLDPISAMSAAGSLSLLMGTFAGVLAVIGNNKAMTLKEIGKTALSLTALVGVTALLAQIIGKLASCNPNGVISIATSLSILLVTMAGVLTILSFNPVMTVGAIAKAGLALAGLTGIVALLALIIGSLSDCNPANALGVATSLSVLLLSMSAVCVILSVAGAAALPALAGIGVLAALVVSVGALMLAIGALADYYPGMESFLDKGIVMLEKIGTGIGSFVGGMIGGAFGSGLAAGLPAIARNLSDFMGELQPFIDGSTNLDPATAAGAKTLAETILILTAADVLSGLTDWFTGGTSLVDFGKEIAAFGPYMREYADSMAGVDTSVVESSANAAEALAKLANNLPATGGKWQEWFGGKSLATFGSQLIAFGECLSEYSKTITAEGGIDADAITGSADAAKGLADLTKNLPSTGGKWQEWFGGKNLATFGTQLQLFGQSLSAYSKTITADGGIDSKAIEKSADAAKGLSNVASNLPSTGGKWQEWFGGKSLSTFGGQLELFGKSISTYSKSVSGDNALDTEAIAASVTASKSLAQLANNLPSYGIFDGKLTPTEFGDEVSAFGTSLSAYCESLVGADMTVLSASITQTNRLISMFKNMDGLDVSNTGTFVTGLQTLAQNGVDGFTSAFANAHSKVSTAVTNFMNASVAGIKGKAVQFTSAGQGAITSLIAGIRVGGNGVPAVVDNIVASALTRIRNQYPAFISAGQGTMTNFIAGIRVSNASTSSAFTTVLGAALTSIKNAYSKFNSAGQGLMTNLSAGAKANGQGAIDAFKNAAGAALTGVRNYYDEFYEAGEYLVKGFAKGIDENTWRAEAKSKAMAKKAIEAAEKELDEHSPSRVFIQIGAYVAQGFANGINGDTRKSTAAAADMAGAAIDTVRASIARISEMVDSEMDTRPTIRPVLDLSNVESGAGRLQALFSRQQALSVNASMERRSAIDGKVDTSTPTAGSTFQFTQINNSPKALSRNEIYRQTSNQFSAFERMVKA